MDTPVYFKANEPKVIHEAYDDEVVIVNLDSGSYYSVENVGAEIWTLLLQGASKDDVVDAFAQEYASSEVDVPEAVASFISELRDEGLIVQTDAPPTRFSNGHTTASAATDFEPPALQTFTDMQDLLLLDPIHEVDDTGWPNARPDLEN